jgi:hypothetical protein
MPSLRRGLLNTLKSPVPCGRRAGGQRATHQGAMMLSLCPTLAFSLSSLAKGRSHTYTHQHLVHATPLSP